MTALSMAGLLGLGAGLGLVMGLLGGGGAVLAVPLLVHVVGTDVSVASATSLLVVLVGAVSGLVAHHKGGRVRWREGLTLGVLGSAGAAGGARLAAVLDDRVLLVLFAMLLLVAAVSMLKRRRDPSGPPRPVGWGRLLLVATALGFVTGLLGVGGGFLAVPALMATLRLPVHEATATGLVVVGVNALVALVARAGHGVDTTLAGSLVGGVILGSALGAVLAPRAPALALRRGFAGLLFVVGIAVGADALL